MRTPYGEIDGTITPRLRCLVKILRTAGIKAYPSRVRRLHLGHPLLSRPSARTRSRVPVEEAEAERGGTHPAFALIPAVAVPFLLAMRISNEQKVLAKGLPGYETYRRRVRYRMIPFVW